MLTTLPLALQLRQHARPYGYPGVVVHRSTSVTLPVLLHGRLIVDNDAAGAVQTLSRVSTNDGFKVTFTSGAGRIFSNDLTPYPAAGENRVLIDAAGLTRTQSRNATGAETSAFPDGMQFSKLMDSDPRFGRSGGFIKSSSLKTLGGLNFTTNTTRTATLSNPADPFSLTTLQETKTVNGKVSKRDYDSAKRMLTETSAAGRVIAKTLDAKGRVVKMQRTGYFPVIYLYDIQGRMVSQSSGPSTAPRTTLFSYGSDSLLASVTNPLGQKTSLARDTALDWVTKKTLPNGQTVLFSYDSNGNPFAVHPPGRPYHRFSYSSVDLTSSYSAPVVGTEPNKINFNYNLDHQITKITYPDGKIINFGYDAAGRLTTTQIDRGILTQTYDATTGTLKSLAAPDGIELAYAFDGSLPVAVNWTGPIVGNVGFAYNNDFNVTSIQLNGANHASYQYDADGLLVKASGLSLSRHASTGLVTATELGSLVHDQFAYNGYGELTGYQAYSGASSLYSAEYTHDKLGRVASLKETVQGQTTIRTYQYSAVGQLVTVRDNGVVKASYTYDANGNRLKLTQGASILNGTYDAQDRLTQYGSANYTFTANGALSKKTVGGLITTYTYDTLGNLITVDLPNGSKISYLIDGQNRRIGKKLNGTLMKGFLYQDQIKHIAELNGAGQVVSRFVYATHVNVPDIMIRGGVTYRIITDHLGSPRLVVNGTTGAVAQRIDYDEFGRVLMDTNPGFQPFGFAGGLYDPDTQLLRFGARDYEAKTGRWTSKDPILLLGGMNLYSYVDSSPISYTDPTGLSRRLVCEKRCMDKHGVDYLSGEIIGDISPGTAAVVGGAVAVGSGLALAKWGAVPVTAVGGAPPVTAVAAGVSGMFAAGWKTGSGADCWVQCKLCETSW